MSRIVAVEARTVRIPLGRGLAFSGRQLRSRDFCLVRVHTADDLVGVGFAHAGHRGGALITRAVTDLLAPHCLGRRTRDVELLWEDLLAQSLLHGRAGSVLRALSAIDIAVWDAHAQHAGMPLAGVLGADRRRVPAYASGGYYRQGKTPDDLGDEIRAYREAGFDAVKIKVGRDGLSADVARVAATREAAGASARVMLDANNAWRDLPPALHAARAFASFDPFWLEEPFWPDDVDNHARLAARTPTTIATGEIEGLPDRHHRLLSLGAVGVLQPDVTVCGGVTGFRRIAADARAHGIPIAPHAFHQVHAHLVAASPGALFVEYFTDASIVNLPLVMDDAFTACAGHVVIPDQPGLGFTFDDQAVDRWASAPWS